MNLGHDVSPLPSYVHLNLAHLRSILLPSAYLRFDNFPGN
jgi:hypothetical protein